MKLIADSGSTKTTWALLDGQGLVSMYDSIGLNPRTTDDGWLSRTMYEMSQWVGSRPVDEVYFYGAGCGTEKACHDVACYIEERFEFAEVFVDSDLHGACIAALGDQPGMVGILGTGSNACLYDGNRPTRRVPSLGYVLGDEGSGNHIGRRLLKTYFEQGMPAELRQLMAQEYDMDYGHVINRLYAQRQANTYLASFAPFASRHREHPFVQTLLKECFEAYFKHIVMPLGEGELHLVGSVAYHFQGEIKAVAETLGFSISATVVKSPIEGLIRYYSSKE